MQSHLCRELTIWIVSNGMLFVSLVLDIIEMSLNSCVNHRAKFRGLSKQILMEERTFVMLSKLKLFLQQKREKKMLPAKI